jgi:hypothetical protein
MVLPPASRSLGGQHTHRQSTRRLRHSLGLLSHGGIAGALTTLAIVLLTWPLLAAVLPRRRAAAS